MLWMHQVFYSSAALAVCPEIHIIVYIITVTYRFCVRNEEKAMKIEWLGIEMGA